MPKSQKPAFPPPVLVTTTEALAALCERLRGERFVTVDTEFMRERTYWPELCVVQLAGDNEVAVVDALAPGLDITPLAALFADPAVDKVFHACRQDIEIFVQKFGAVPAPLFDTQVAAMVAGFGDQVAYDALVAALTGGHIDKAHRFSDWAARPLSQAQITYAAADVTHLRGVYTKLRARLEKEGRFEWVAEELAVLADPATYQPDPEQMWERLKPRTNNRRMLGVLRAVAAWREREAQRSNIPRGRMLKDESLLEIAATAPVTLDDLARCRGITRGNFSTTVTFSPRAASARAVFRPIRPDPATTAAFASPAASIRSCACCIVHNVRTPGAPAPGISGMKAFEPVASSSRS